MASPDAGSKESASSNPGSGGEAGRVADPADYARLRRRFRAWSVATVSSAFLALVGLADWVSPGGSIRPDPFATTPGAFDWFRNNIPHPALQRMTVVPVGVRGTLTWKPIDTSWVNTPYWLQGEQPLAPQTQQTPAKAASLPGMSAAHAQMADGDRPKDEVYLGQSPARTPARVLYGQCLQDRKTCVRTGEGPQPIWYTLDGGVKWTADGHERPLTEAFRTGRPAAAVILAGRLTAPDASVETTIIDLGSTASIARGRDTILDLPGPAPQISASFRLTPASGGSDLAVFIGSNTDNEYAGIITPDGQRIIIQSPTEKPPVGSLIAVASDTKAQSVGARAVLNVAVVIAPTGARDEPAAIWAAGDAGLLIKYDYAASAAEPEQVATRTTANLRSIHFHDGRVGWISSGWFDGNDEGARPLILQTVDGGRSWTRLSYRHWPAPWTFASAFGLILAFVGFVGARTELKNAQPPTVGIEDTPQSDKPIGWDAPDALGLQPIARAMSRFLRNVNTTPPVTFAISGEWGSGKSSLMNLVYDDLRLYGGRVIWFNAWHHQKEEHLLAALLDAIRRDAAPSWWRLSGLWFRARLIWSRSAKDLKHLMAVAFVVAVVCGILVFDGHWGSARLGAFLADSTRLLGADNWGTSLLVGVGSLGALGAAVAVLWRVLRLFRVIPADPAALLAGIVQRSTIRNASDKLSFRHRFASEFGDVCKVVRTERNPGLIIFIDDLDRCRPDAVLEALEAVNFLVNAGPCFVILGIDEDKVRDAVAAGFEKQVLRLDGNDIKPDGPSLKAFSHSYLEKLINLTIRVPRLNDDQMGGLLTGQHDTHGRAAPMAGETPYEGFGANAMRALFRSARECRMAIGTARDTVGGLALIALVAVPFTWGVLERVEDMVKQAAKAPAAAIPPAVKTADTKAAAGATTPSAPATTVPARLPTAESLDIDGLRPISGWWLAGLGLALLALVGSLVTRRTLAPAEARVDDSPAFKVALGAWADVIHAGCRTPRAAKRFINRLRFVAMRARPEPARAGWIDRVFGAPAPAEEGVASTAPPPSALVALAAVEVGARPVFDMVVDRSRSDGQSWRDLDAIYRGNAYPEGVDIEALRKAIDTVKQGVAGESPLPTTQNARVYARITGLIVPEAATRK